MSNKIRTFPVIELFGPTIQGEGLDAGKPVYFIRFGGCDYKCSWCDSWHAVDPTLVRQAERFTPNEIIERFLALDNPPEVGSTIVFSGGNPALQQLDELVDLLHDRSWLIAVETQGTRFRNWINNTDTLIISPKPPSSRMNHRDEVLDKFIDSVSIHKNKALKIVVGDTDDYEFAVHIHKRYPDIEFYVSVLNPDGSDTDSFEVEKILIGYKTLCERVAKDGRMIGVRVMPQLHTLAWGAEVGR